MSVTRRGFLQTAAVATAGAVAFTGCAAPDSLPEFQIQSPARLAEDLVTGLDNYYASVCRECGAGCGIIARVLEGRALKLEGNPDYPVNVGRLSARGQAGVQALYHPDRIAGPLRLAGSRGSGQFRDVSWDEGLAELTDRLRTLAGQNQAGAALFVTEPLRGHSALVVDRFARSYGAQQVTFEPLDRRAVVREAIRRVFGFDQLPDFDVANAKQILSFGADFLGTWLSPVHYGRGFGSFRQGRPGVRGHFVQVEPRMSQTGAAADEWLPIKPGTEGVLALSIAQAMVATGKVNPQALAALTGPAGAAALAPFDPQQTAATTGVPAEKVAAIARSLVEDPPALIIGGDSAAAHTNGLFNLVAIYSLNVLAGSVGQAGGVRPNPPSPFPDLPTPARTTLADWQRLTQSMSAGQVQLLLVHGANPVYGLPAALKPGDAVAGVPFIVSFSTFMDETTALADLVLPDLHFLESWGDDVPDPLPGYQTVGFQQPVVNPFVNTRGFADVLLGVAAQLGGEVQRALPWGSFKALLQDAASQLQRLGRGTVTGGSPETYWVQLLQRGGWWDPATRVQVTPAAPAAALPTPAVPPKFEGSEQEYPYYLHVYPSPTLDAGEAAHLPWLQGLPDPTTTAVWTTWVELNPATAARLGVQEADLVAVESPTGSVEVPAYVYPAIAPDVVGMPLGQGHTAYGRYARGRGVNPLDLVAPQTDADTGALAWSATRVRIRKTGRSLRRLPKFEGIVEPLVYENIPLLLEKDEA